MFTLAFGLLMQVALLGTDQSFVRMFYEKEENLRRKLLWESLSLPLLWALVISAVLIISWRWTSNLLFGETTFLLPIVLLALTLVVGVLERFSTLVLRMKKRGIAFSSLRVVNVSITAGTTIAYALFFSRDFYAVIVGIFVGHFVTLVISVSMEREFWRPVFGFTREVKDILLYGLPFVPTFLITWIFQSMDRLALRSFSTFEEIGLYAAAFKLVSVLMLLQVGFTTFWTPTAYETYEKNPDDTSLYRKAFSMIAALMMIVGSLAILFKDAIIIILASSYRGAASIMPFLIFNPVMYTVSETTVSGINFKKKTHWHLWISIVVAITNLIGNTLLVPVYGAKGAAFSTGVSYIIFFYMRTLISQKLYPVDYSLDRFTLATLALVAQSFVNTFMTNVIIQITSSIIALLMVMLLYRSEMSQILTLSKNIIVFLKRRRKSSKASA